MTTHISDSQQPVFLTVTPLQKTHRMEAPATDRQEKIKGFSQNTFRKLRLNLIGAGGLGSEIGEGLVRKGVGSLSIFDDDTVELSNLNRQRFYKKDLYKNKAVQLAQNLVHDGIGDTRLNGFPWKFQDAAGFDSHDIGCDVAVCGVDNDAARVFVSDYYYRRNIPVIFTAVNELGNAGYVYVQEPGKACFGCFRPDAINDGKNPCPGTPAIKDILKVVGGIVLYAVDTLFMDRMRVWNYKEMFLDGTIPEFCSTVERKKGCSICD